MTIPISGFTAAANSTAIGMTGYSLTGSAANAMVDLAGTLNTSGNPIALKIALTNTASGATTKFVSFLAGAAGATEIVSINLAGVIEAPLGSATAPSYKLAGGVLGMYGRTSTILAFATGSTERMRIVNSGVAIGSTMTYEWSSATDPSAGSDVYLSRRAAAVVQLGAADAA